MFNLIWVKIFFVVVASILLSSSCKKETCNKPTTYEVTPLGADDTSFLPYTGFDSLYFERSDSTKVIDTLLFVGSGKKYYNNYIKLSTTKEGCLVEHSNRSFYIRFKSTTKNDSFSIDLLNNVSGSPEVYFVYKDNSFSYSAIFLRGLYGWTYISHDIGGKTYSFVMRGCDEGADACSKYYTLYNKTHGILAMSDLLYSNYRLILIEK